MSAKFPRGGAGPFLARSLLVKSAQRKFNFLISQPKDMLWVLKIPVSLKHNLKLMGKKRFTIVR